jgi:DUF971 family protein
MPPFCRSLPILGASISMGCAEVQGHSAREKRMVTGKENVAIVAIEPVGNYAIKIVFDDGHDTGLFTWDYLRKLAR